jgi:hypothetical protein
MRVVGIVTVDHIWGFMQRRRAAVTALSPDSSDRQTE